MLPVWRTDRLAGMTSYQRTIEPDPPAIVCWVQIASAPPALGSSASTACVRRPSNESSVSVVPGCGTAGGTEKLGTGTSPSAISAGEPLASPICQSIRWLPELSPVLSLKSAAITYPGDAEPSETMAGSGVKARSPAEVINGLEDEPKTVNAGALGQLLIVPAAGFAPTRMCAV